MVSIRVNDIHELHLPSGWNELRGEQLLAIAEALFMEMDDDRKRVMICKAAINNKKLFRMMEPAILIEQFFPLITWIETDRQLTKQVLPTIPVGFFNWYGPAESLGNFRLSEFDHAEAELYRWHSFRPLDSKLMFAKGESNPLTGDLTSASETPKSTYRGLMQWWRTEEAEAQLYRFVACVYRPGKLTYNKRKNPAGDYRMPFNDNLVDYHASILRRHLPVKYAYAILLWYKGCRDALVSAFPLVFTGAAEHEAKPQQEPNYFELMRKIAEKGTYGDIDKVRNLYLWDAMYEVHLSIEEYNKLKEETEKK